MSPRYEIDIPADASAILERFVQSQGGEIVRKSLTPQEEKKLIDEAWEKEAGEARRLIYTMLRVSNFDERRRVFAGLDRLAKNIGGSELAPIQKTSDYLLLRNRLGAVLLEELPQEAPEWVAWDDINSQLKRKEVKPDLPIGKKQRVNHPQPRGIALFIRNYGLDGFFTDSIDELAREYNVSRTSLNGRIQSTVTFLRDCESLRKILFPSQS